MSNDAGRAVARLLFEAGAIHVTKERPFVLAAGWASPVYIDVRRLIGERALRRAVVDIALAEIAGKIGLEAFDAVAGAETAGIAYAAWLADRMETKLRYVRKRPLGIGRGAQVEGGSVEGLRILLVDDLTTDGTSKINFARGLRSAGAVVEHALSIFYHDFPQATARLTASGLKHVALASWADVLDMDTSPWMTGSDRAEIEAFAADPVAWSARHGGRMSLPDDTQS